MKIHCLDVLLWLDTLLKVKYIFFACLLFLLEKSCTIIKSHIMSTKNQQKIEKRKEKQMPGNVRFTITPELKRQIKKIIDERINEVHVTKEDFSELKAIVSDIAISIRELAEAQKRTELRVEEISKTQNELAEAQKRTELRVEELSKSQNELAEAQKRTEVRMGELAEAQKRTEVRMGELVEAQKRTEVRMGELAEAQKRTEVRMEELAEAQKRTEVRMEELAEAQKRTEVRMEELAEAQKRTEVRMEELAEAQKRTEVRMEELTEAQKRTEEEVRKLAIGLHDTRVHLGGLSRSFGYAFENEAYRNLPKLLYDRYGYEVKERVVRAEVGGKEINFFGKAIKNGKEIYIVGESKVRLDEGQWRSEVFEYLQEKINAIREVYGDVPILPILVTHFATQGFIKEATQKGIIVIQSYEW